MKWDCQVAKNLVQAAFNRHLVLVWLGRSYCWKLILWVTVALGNRACLYDVCLMPW